MYVFVWLCDSSPAGVFSTGSWCLPQRRRHLDVTAVVRSCFAALRQIQSVRRSFLLTLVFSTMTRLADCPPVSHDQQGRLLLLGLGWYFWSPSKQASVGPERRRSTDVFNEEMRTHNSSPLLRELHWLRIPEWIQFRLCVLTYRCLHGTDVSNLTSSLSRLHHFFIKFKFLLNYM